MKISVCIPTHERHALLERCLSSLLEQTRLPDEVIVADSSPGEAVAGFYQEWAHRFQPVTFIYARTNRRSVVNNRWEAFLRSSGDLIFYSDDDMRYTKDAIAEMHSTFENYPDSVGAGLKIYYEGPPVPRPLRTRLRGWWLSDDGTGETNSITAGGRSMSGRDRVEAKPIPVQWLFGGAMCFRREALNPVGPLPGLDELFELRIGGSADTVLSRHVGLAGRLMMLTKPLGWHPERRIATSTALSIDGWQRGLRDTVGRAHVLHWLARDQRAVSREWLRLVPLYLARAAKDILVRPFSAASWMRLSGFLYGSLLTVLIWRRIPGTPQESITFDRKWLLT